MLMDGKNIHTNTISQYLYIYKSENTLSFYFTKIFQNRIPVKSNQGMKRIFSHLKLPHFSIASP